MTGRLLCSMLENRQNQLQLRRLSTLGGLFLSHGVCTLDKDESKWPGASPSGLGPFPLLRAPISMAVRWRWYRQSLEQPPSLTFCDSASTR